MSKRAILALGLLCAAGSWLGQAQAASYTATYNIPDTGGAFGAFVNHFEGPIPHTNIDVINVNLTGPGRVDSDGHAGTVALKISAGPFTIAGFSLFEWTWKSDNLVTNLTGSFSTILQNSITLPFTATPLPGDVYFSPGGPLGHNGTYHLFIKSITSGFSGGGYVYSLEVQPCSDCAATVVPVPPAAALFASALAGLGVLSRRRRKRAQAI